MSLLTRVGWRRNGTLIGRRPGGNFIEGANVSIAAADNPSNGRVDYTISASPSGVSPLLGFPDCELAAPISAGGSTLQVTRGAPASMFNSKLAVLAIDYGGANCECKLAVSLTGSTFTVSTPFKMAHAAGAPVMWIRHGLLNPMLYGAKLDGTTDDWSAMQRLLLDAPDAGAIDGQHARSNPGYTISRTLCYTQSTRIKNCSFVSAPQPVWNPANTGGDNFIFTGARNYSRFTATASNDTVTLLDAEAGMVTNGNRVTLSDPYAGGFPGGVVQGKTYYVRDANPGAKTCKLSTNPALSDTVNITSDGGGYFFGNQDSTSKIFIDGLYLSMYADIGGIRLCPEQPSVIRDLNIELTFAATSPESAVGMYFSGNTQYVNISNLEINPATNVLGMLVQGTGVVVNDKITMNAQGQAARIAGSDHHFLGGWLLERPHHPCGIELGTGQIRNVSLGPIYFSAENLTDPLIHDTSGGNGSYTIGQIVCPGTGIFYFRNPDVYGDLYGWDGNTPGDGISDENFVVPPTIQMKNGALDFEYRRARFVSGNWTFRPIDNSYHVNASAAARTGTLHSAAGWGGLRYTIARSAGSNNVTINPSAGETIDGASSLVVTATPKTIMAASGGWITV